MKKFVAILLTLMLVLGMTAAFAEGNEEPVKPAEEYKDVSTVTIKKAYKLTNAGTTSPAETFTLEQIGNGVVTDGDATSAPALGTITGAEFAKGAATVDGITGNITVALPTYEKVGVYEYTLKEVAGKNAGVNYYGSDIKLVVTVINGENGKLRIAAVHTEAAGGTKSNTFTNTYSAGSLKVTKTVTGNLGDKEKEFDFTVTFTKPEGKDWDMDGIVLPTGATKNSDGTYSFKLKHDATAEFKNLPYGVSYVVKEADYSDYTTTKEGDEGTINTPETTAAFTNYKGGEIDTGVTTESLPYVVLMGFVVLAGAALLLKRKAHNN